MPVTLRGPVGLRWRTQNVANYTDDQAAVISLLRSIPAAKGGKAEAWSAPPLAGPNGAVPLFVSNAIWDFQSWWKALGAFQNIDGVVDPGGHTLWQLNNLAAGGSSIPSSPGPTPASPGVIVPPPGPTAFDNFVTRLVQLFPHRTDWSYAGGWGGSLGVFMFSGAGGRIDLENKMTSDSGGMYFAAVGGNKGFDSGPDVTFTYSTPSMWSRGIGNIYSASTDDLSFDDFTGPMLVASIAATSQLAAGQGGSLNLIFFGLPMLLSVEVAVGGPAALGLIVQAVAQAKGLSVTVGRAVGADASSSLCVGYAASLSL